MRVFTLALVLCLLPLGAQADDEVPAEIEYLLRSVGSSGCAFIRNGKRYDPRKAEDHLRMKYRRGKRYAATSEKFIERLASASSMSKKLYYIECEDEEMMPSGDWLLKRLGEYRTDATLLDVTGRHNLICPSAHGYCCGPTLLILLRASSRPRRPKWSERFLQAMT